MKLLMSAYACEPNQGSEAGIGWNWVLETTRLGHEVWALTRANNREVIERELSKTKPMENLKFLYYDLCPWTRWWKKGERGIYLYYLLWQWGAYLLAKKVHNVERFDQVHHITFASVRQPSFMGNLGIPFIFGPVAGGERAPWRLGRSYGWRGWVTECVRDLANFLPRMDPLVRRTFKQAERIYVTSEQTLSLLPRKYRQKTSVQLAIGFNPSELTSLPEQRNPDRKTNGRFRILFVGRLLYWKGMHLGFQAFARLLEERPYARLTMVGKGRDERQWRTLAKKLGVGNRIDWVPWLDRKDLPEIFSSHDVFLFPSLHDSGGMVVLEAMAHGLPVVCLDLGGPGQIVDDTCGFVIKTKGLNEESVIWALANCLTKLAEDSALRKRLSEGAAERVKKFRRSAQVGRIYSKLN